MGLHAVKLASTGKQDEWGNVKPQSYRSWEKRITNRLLRRLWKRKGEDAPTKLREITKGYE